MSRSRAAGRADSGSVSRLPAPEIEAIVLRAASPHSLEQSERELILTHLHQVTVHESRIKIAIRNDDAPIHLPWSPVSAQRRREIVMPSGSDPQIRPMKVEDRARILKGIATGRAWLDELMSGRVASTEAIAARERCSERSLRMTLSLAFLSPPIVEAIVAGALPRGIGISRLADLPPSWTQQHTALGI